MTISPIFIKFKAMVAGRLFFNPKISRFVFRLLLDMLIRA